jgi:hypothetical protein
MTRRIAIRMIEVLFVAVVLTAALLAQTPVRMSWQTFAKDPKRVQSFRNAVFVMKTANLADPTSVAFRSSWNYWGNMHGYFGPQSRFGTIMGWVTFRGIDLTVWGPYFQGVTNDVPPDATAKDVWSQCQHSSRAAGITKFFFPWHRLYLLYFEKVLQKAANDPSLRLPYWDYTDPASVAMPAEFMTPTYTNANGDVLANPLFEFRRMPGWLAPPFSTLDPVVTNVDKALSKIDLLLDSVDKSGNVVPGYQSTIEQEPHGSVHCAVMDCPTPVMGAVPYSANDPIFWIHHANIDRLWDCWTSVSGHANPTDAPFLGQAFTYVDENGTEVTKTVDDIIGGGMVDYVYEKASNCARAVPVVLAASAAQLSAKQVRSARQALAKPVILGSASSVTIDAATTKASISLPADGSRAQPRDLALRTQSDVALKTQLVLRGIHYAKHPGVIFKVFLERKDDPSKRAFVGAFSFFMPLDDSDAEHHDGSSKLDRVFDVTDEIRSLGSENLQEVNVVFEAATGRISAERPRFKPEAKLVIDTVELRVSLVEETPKK